MAESNPNKQAQSLLSLYATLYKDKYGKPITFNRFKEKWAMTDVIDSVGYERATELLEYYFTVTKPGHPLQWFFYNFDRLDEIIKQVEEDQARREKIRQQTKKMVEEAENNEH